MSRDRKRHQSARTIRRQRQRHALRDLEAASPEERAGQLDELRAAWIARGASPQVADDVVGVLARRIAAGEPVGGQEAQADWEAAVRPLTET